VSRLLSFVVPEARGSRIDRGRISEKYLWTAIVGLIGVISTSGVTDSAFRILLRM
jgi:hypothetical protein